MEALEEGRGGRGREVGRGFLKRRGGTGGGAEPKRRQKVTAVSDNFI